MSLVVSLSPTVEKKNETGRALKRSIDRTFPILRIFLNTTRTPLLCCARRRSTREHFPQLLSFFLTMIIIAGFVARQETKASDCCEERAEEEDLDGHELLPSPDSGKSTDNEAALSPIKIRSDVNGLDHEECDELIHVENTTQACIMHTLSIVSSARPLPSVSCFLFNLRVRFLFTFVESIEKNSLGFEIGITRCYYYRFQEKRTALTLVMNLSWTFCVNVIPGRTRAGKLNSN